MMHGQTSVKKGNIT